MRGSPVDSHGATQSLRWRPLSGLDCAPVVSVYTYTFLWESPLADQMSTATRIASHADTNA